MSAFDVQPGEAVGIIGRQRGRQEHALKIPVAHHQADERPGEAPRPGGQSAGSRQPASTGADRPGNIYLNGAILGMTRREIARKFDEIVAFAETEPVPRHAGETLLQRHVRAPGVCRRSPPGSRKSSSWMRCWPWATRTFQKKCLTKMGHVPGKGGPCCCQPQHGRRPDPLPAAFCWPRASCSRKDRARDVVAEYLAGQRRPSAPCPWPREFDRSGAGRFRFEELTILNAKGERRGLRRPGEDLTIRLRLATPGLDAPCPHPLDVASRYPRLPGQRITELASYFTASSPTSVATQRE